MPRACHDECKGAVGLKAWPVLGISIVQGILCLAHWFIYLTWMHFGWPLSPGALHGLRVALAVLSFSFAFSALLSFRLVHPLVRLIYRIAVLWLGFAHFIFMACVTAWLVDPFLLFVAGPQRSAARHGLAAVLCLAVLAAVAYGLINARIIRVRRIPVTLPNLPAAWRGRTALLLSDLHLGNVNTERFAARITRIARSLSPDVVLISGDLYDGARDKPAQLAEPLFHINTPLGTSTPPAITRNLASPRAMSRLSRARPFACSTMTASKSTGCASQASPISAPPRPCSCAAFLRA